MKVLELNPGEVNADPYLSFTAAERRLAELLLEGICLAEIARKLKIDRQSVRNHANKMYRKAGIVSGCKQVKLAMLLSGQRIEA